MSETLAGTEAKAVGIVTEHTSRWSRGPDRPSLLFLPSVRFQTPDGRTVEFQNGIGTNAPPRVGDEVTVIYDPARPEEAKVALSDTFRINPKVFLAVGAIFLGAAAFFFLFFVAMILWATMS